MEIMTPTNKKLMKIKNNGTVPMESKFLCMDDKYAVYEVIEFDQNEMQKRVEYWQEIAHKQGDEIHRLQSELDGLQFKYEQIKGQLESNDI
jgi:hypothetical protein